MGKRNLKQFVGVVLCAGFGTRIQKKTNTPKTLLEINGESIIERIIKSFENNNIKKIIIVIGYKGNLIKKHVYSKFSKNIDIKFVFNKNPKKFGNTYSLYLGIKNVLSNVIIVDGDLIFDERIISLIDKKNKDQIVVGKGQISDIECAKTLLDKRGFIKKTIDKRGLTVSERKLYKFIGEAIGIIKISKKNIKKFKNYCVNFLKKKNLKLNWEHLINFYVMKNNMYPLKIKQNFKWSEIDTPYDYKIAKKIFKK